MIDINKTLDLVKLRLYNEYLYTAHLEVEEDSEFHEKLTKQVVAAYIDPLELKKDARILDIGCGPGYFMDEMKERGFTNVTGISVSEVDKERGATKGHNIELHDMSFLPQQAGFYDESVDFIFLRQVLEHSPYPIFSLMEYNRILKQYGLMYIEVPCPGGERNLESYLNHYSIMGHEQLVALLVRCGFSVEKLDRLDFELSSKDDPDARLKEAYYSLIVKKQRPIDIK